MWLDDQMDAILEAAATEFAACGNGERPCYVARTPGSAPTDVMCEDGGCGQVTLRLVQAFPSDPFPQQADPGSPCGKPLAYVMELRSMRCYEDTDQRGEAIDPEGATGGSEQANADMLAMLRAINCRATGRRTSVQSYDPEGPQGNYVGGSWTFTIAEDN